MNFFDYIKDRLTAIIIMVFAIIVIVIFMAAFRTPLELICAVVIVIALAACAACVLDYLRRRTFYDKLIGNLDELDRKYLISEMIEEADFYEARLISDILRTANKSMCDNVAFYKNENKNFREYIDMWVHEIKLPVSSLSLMLHNDGNSDNKAAEQLRRIDSAVDTVLYYARCENAERDYIIKEISLKTAVKNAVIKYREDIQLNGISLDVNVPDIMVMTDGKWLEFMLVQLISNSIKYRREDRESVIRITAEESEDSVKLHLFDNGIGIPKSDLPYIFDRSFTGENGRIRSKSTGMGLYIVRNLCEKLGHTVNAESNQGKFTEITITFGKNDFFKM